MERYVTSPFRVPGSCKEGKCMISRIEGLIAERLAKSKKSSSPVDKDTMQTLEAAGQILPLRQIFDFYTIPIEARSEVIKCTKPKAHLEWLWDPESEVWQGRQDRRMDATAWLSMCHDSKITEIISHAKCLEVFIGRPSTNQGVFLKYVSGEGGLDPSNLVVDMKDFLVALEGLVREFGNTKGGDNNPVDNPKLMKKHVQELLHRMFSKSPINRYLVLRNYNRTMPPKYTVTVQKPSNGDGSKSNLGTPASGTPAPGTPAPGTPSGSDTPHTSGDLDATPQPLEAEPVPL